MFAHRMTQRIVSAALIVLVASGLLVILAPQVAFAQPTPTPAPTGQTSGSAQQQATVVSTESLPKTTAGAGKLQQIINVALGIIGAAALLAISVGGLRYVLAHGDPNAITQAKNNILYALIGLMVVIIAGAIVNFVVENVQ